MESGVLLTLRSGQPQNLNFPLLYLTQKLMFTTGPRTGLKYEGEGESEEEKEGVGTEAIGSQEPPSERGILEVALTESKE